MESANSSWATTFGRTGGAHATQPEGEVYVVVGDGTYLMSELVTAVQEGLVDYGWW